jgi:class 3 adenylate cyclase
VLFADLKGFTSFSERSDSMEVSAMLNEYFKVAVPVIANEHGGEVDKLIGDAIMVTFNTRGDQPDHAVRAVQAGLALQRETARIVKPHPGWPRFRVGVNSGKATVGLIGAEGGRGYTVIGDTVNLASRLEGQAKVGQVVIGAETYSALPEGTKVEPLGGVRVKGKEAEIEAYVVVEMPLLIEDLKQVQQRKPSVFGTTQQEATSPPITPPALPSAARPGGSENLSWRRRALPWGTRMLFWALAIVLAAAVMLTVVEGILLMVEIILFGRI